MARLGEFRSRGSPLCFVGTCRFPAILHVHLPRRPRRGRIDGERNLSGNVKLSNPRRTKMSSKSSISVIFVAIVCSVLAWVVYVHIFSQEDVTGILVCSTVLSLCVWGNALFVGLILRDT